MSIRHGKNNFLIRSMKDVISKLSFQSSRLLSSFTVPYENNAVLFEVKDRNDNLQYYHIVA